MTWWKELMLYLLLTAWTLFWAAFGYYAGYADGKIFQRRNQQIYDRPAEVEAQGATDETTK